VKVFSTLPFQVVDGTRCSDKDLCLAVRDYLVQPVIVHDLLCCLSVSFRMVGPTSRTSDLVPVIPYVHSQHAHIHTQMLTKAYIILPPSFAVFMHAHTHTHTISHTHTLHTCITYTQISKHTLCHDHKQYKHNLFTFSRRVHICVGRHSQRDVHVHSPLTQGISPTQQQCEWLRVVLCRVAVPDVCTLHHCNH